MIKYNFNKEIQVFEVVYLGNIEIEDIINLAKFIAKNKQLPRKLYMLTDARNANYNFNHNEMKENLEFIKQAAINYEFMRDAMIHSSPRETAYSHISEFIKIDNYAHKVFATKQAALEWLKLV